MKRSSPDAISLPPMVGRATECALIREMLAAVTAGRGQFVIIGGEAGIGKTTLVRYLVATARQEGYCLLSGQSHDLTAAGPYGIWLDLAAGYQRAHASDPAMPPVPPLLASYALDGISSQAELFAQVRPFLQALAAIQPVVVVLEDIHWADPASLELLRYISSHLSDTPLLLMVTYRIDELTRQNSFYQQLPALIRESEGLRLDLKRLSRGELGQLVASMQYGLTAVDTERLIDYLDAHAEGNPFYAIELLRALEAAESGGLDHDSAGWRLAELDRVIVPSLVQQVIDSRIARLGEETRGPLTIAAVVGQNVALDLWADVAGLSEDELFAIIDRAVDLHLFSAMPDGTQVQFVHALTRSALYESILPPRRRRIHRLVADALMTWSPDDADAIAYHLQQAGDPRAPDWLIAAGERAQRAYAWLTAKDRFLAAEELLHGVPGAELTRARLLYRCSRLQRYSNALAGIPNLRTAVRLAELANDPVLAADAIYSQALLHCFGDEWRFGLHGMIDGIERLEALPLNVARTSWSTVTWMADALPAIDWTASSEIDPAAERLTAAGVNHRRGGLPWFMAETGYLREARAEAESFSALVEGIAAGPLVLSSTGHATFGYANALAMLGAPDDARRAFRHARDVYERLDHHAVIAFTLVTELIDLTLPYYTPTSAERQRLSKEIQAGFELAGGALPIEISGRRVQLMNMYLDGHWAEATAIGLDVTPFGNYIIRRQITNALAPIAYHQGRADDVWSEVARLLPLGPETEPGDAVLLDGLLLQRLAAHLCLDRGDRETAHSWLEANDRWLAWSGSVLGRSENQRSWARWHREAGVDDEARRLADRAVAAAQDPRQPLALMAALRLRGEIALDHDDLAGAERNVTMALEMAESCELPFERAQSLLLLARVNARHGRTDAIELIADARQIAQHLQAQPLLDRIDAIEHEVTAPVAQPAPSGLTARELDVLRLAAQGFTDAEIGEQLFISPRTASQHLRSIYGKVGVRSRAAATRFAIEHHLA